MQFSPPDSGSTAPQDAGPPGLPSARGRLIGSLVALVVLAAVVVASLISLAPPAPAGADAPSDQFSAGRAYRTVQTIGEHVHVTGSPAAADVRGEIVARLTDLGYHPQIEPGIGETAALGGPAMARVNNVVTRIKGTDSTGQLILMAHYDSVQVSYGANDDGSGVATLLEVARALTAGPPLRNDVILLFTDAEEACLCGAEAFVHSDPLAKAGGVVLNFESRGSSGPSIMFETAAGNADLVAQYAKSVPYPVATSMAVEVYRILPNDTDFTPFRTSGHFTGLNSAYIDGSAVYHSPEDRPEYMDTGTLQAHGANALALTRQLGGANLAPLAKPAAYDATYFPVFTTLVRYPGYWVWPLAIPAALAVGGLLVLLRRRDGIGWGRMAASAGLMVVPLAVSAVIAQAYWMLLVALRPGYGSMLDPWRPGWYRIAVCALVVVVTVGWYALLRRRFRPWGLASGGLAVLAVLGLVLAAVTPGGSYLAAIPALAGAIAGMLALLVRRWWATLAATTVAGAIAAAVLAPTALLFFPALGLATGAAGALIVAMLAIALLPALEFLHPEPAAPAAMRRADRRAAPPGESVVGAPDPIESRPSLLARAAVTLVAAAVAVAATGIGLATDRFDARHPQPTQLMYALDADTGTAHWVSEQSSRIAWTDHYLTGTSDLSGTFPMLRGRLTTGGAQAANLPPSTATVRADDARSGNRWVTVAICPQRDVRLLDIAAPGSTVLSATVVADGQTRGLPAADGPFELLFHGPGSDGIILTLKVQGTAPITLRIADGSDGLADLPGFVPRPADVGVQGSHTSELVLVSTSVTI